MPAIPTAHASRPPQTLTLGIAIVPHIIILHHLVSAAHWPNSLFSQSISASPILEPKVNKERKKGTDLLPSPPHQPGYTRADARIFHFCFPRPSPCDMLHRASGQRSWMTGAGDGSAYISRFSRAHWSTRLSNRGHISRCLGGSNGKQYFSLRMFVKVAAALANELCGQFVDDLMSEAQMSENKYRLPDPSAVMLASSPTSRAYQTLPVTSHTCPLRVTNLQRRVTQHPPIPYCQHRAFCHLDRGMMTRVGDVVLARDTGIAAHGLRWNLPSLDPHLHEPIAGRLGCQSPCRRLFR
jgi:hypothetical protein